jgi:two-component system OmpR family response regulator
MPISSVPPRRTLSGVRPRGPLVLLIEGEDSLRDRYAAELAAAGFLVLAAGSAGDGAVALQMAVQFHPQAVVLELDGGGVDSVRIASRLRTHERTQDVAIVALTSASRTVGAGGLAAGCDTILRKPVLAAALIGELIRLIARRAHTPRPVSADPTLPDPVEAKGTGSAEGGER